ncbi:MAG: phosphomannomutase [Bdellovibrionales bacterium RIFCSPHIGHO2_01_FULL_40_29]|nr:MAG: phosphomannomutase [Bdellovibrionales bacterium RIFCSPHIGHO2_01_FULL_40_29]OFZ34669.1 MAG: phosphomannomutase [Bdellovibrionales bacterium RIFCSPHIGHO2_02_FULL_40_15]
MFEPVIFREYDIRGVYNQQFDLDFAYQLGKTFASYVLKKSGKKNMRLSVGYDARVSSVPIMNKVTQGMKESGAEVYVLGLVTSPMCYFSTFQLDLDGAIMVTGSHNPPDFNGFKVSLGKTTIHGEEIQSLKKIMEAGDFISGEGSIKDYDIFPEYLERYKKEFGTMAPVKVVLDCGNGAGGVIARKLFNVVGLQPEILFEQPDGAFPNHHPDPTVEKNLVALAAKVRETGAVAGIGFDGDADRIGVVDHTGRMIYGDELMTIYARAILENSKGAKIVGDVKCSDFMYTDIAKHGGEPILWKTGHSLIKEKVKSEKAPFGGEMSGHIFFADRNYGYDDAPYAGLRLCEILAKSGKNIAQLLEGFPKAFNTPEIRIDTTEEKKVLIVEKVKEKFLNLKDPNIKVNLIDGIRISFPDGWALARSSNTQPVIVVRFESTSADGLARIQDSVMSVVNQYL